jgi:hypothetical protein
MSKKKAGPEIRAIADLTDLSRQQRCALLGCDTVRARRSFLKKVLRTAPVFLAPHAVLVGCDSGTGPTSTACSCESDVPCGCESDWDAAQQDAPRDNTPVCKCESYVACSCDTQCSCESYCACDSQCSCEAYCSCDNQCSCNTQCSCQSYCPYECCDKGCPLYRI